MKSEFEIIKHPNIKYLNVFLVNIDYRTPHLHQDIELILIIDGEVTITSKHESHHLSQDSAVIFNANEPHEIRACKNSALILCLQVSPKFCYNYFPDMPNLTFDSFNINQNISKECFKYIKALTIELAYQYYAKRKGYEFSCMSILNLLFRVFLDFLPFHIVSDEEKKANLQKVERLNRILNYIDENYMQKLRLSDIAEKENLSMSYLSHFIKDNLNQSFQEYVNNHRFNYAKKLLLTKDMQLIDICIECGFSDYRYLYKVFRENYGCTPNEYRKLYSKIPLETIPSSPLSSENFYTTRNALDILEKLHIQNKQILYDYTGYLISQ